MNQDLVAHHRVLLSETERCPGQRRIKRDKVTDGILRYIFFSCRKYLLSIFFKDFACYKVHQSDWNFTDKIDVSGRQKMLRQVHLKHFI